VVVYLEVLLFKSSNFQTPTALVVHYDYPKRRCNLYPARNTNNYFSCLSL